MRVLPDEQSLAPGAMAAGRGRLVGVYEVGDGDAFASVAYGPQDGGDRARVSGAVQELSSAEQWVLSDADAVCREQPEAGRAGQTQSAVGVGQFGDTHGGREG